MKQLEFSDVMALPVTDLADVWKEVTAMRRTQKILAKYYKMRSEEAETYRETKAKKRSKIL